MKRMLASACAAVVCALASSSAVAGMQMLADRGCGQYNFDGQCWNAMEPTLNIALNGAFVALDFNGTGAPPTRFITLDPAGRVVFTNTLGGTPTGDVVNVAYLGSSGGTYTADSSVFLSTIEITTGYLAPVVVDPTRPITYDNTLSTYDPSQDLNAVRFWWDSACVPGGPCDGSGNGRVSFQAVFVNLGNDSFLLEFNYGFNGNRVPSTAVGGYTINGVSSAPITTFSGQGPDYCFNHGVVSRFTTINACTNAITAVPEPMSIALFFTGLAFLVSFETRRRRPMRATAIR